ncbi:RHS repeat-associated core domain-containing protein [Parvularcula sp. LCG005]|uniref:RHS repeat-associated core domain-containing protein n=1 Tax=Parvularcula sp. LCG005 TaxID=3078805 RepID=UPI003978137B
MVQTEVQTPFDEIYSSTNNSGGYVARNKYDDYGDPSSTNTTRFQYTGQIYLKTAGLYHYKARAYHPGIGRFLQTDPIGYGDGLNMYAYVGGDPVNGRDPSGLYQCTGSERVVCAPPTPCGMNCNIPSMWPDRPFQPFVPPDTRFEFDLRRTTGFQMSNGVTGPEEKEGPKCSPAGVAVANWLISASDILGEFASIAGGVGTAALPFSSTPQGVATSSTGFAVSGAAGVGSAGAANAGRLFHWLGGLPYNTRNTMSELPEYAMLISGRAGMGAGTEMKRGFEVARNANTEIVCRLGDQVKVPENKRSCEEVWGSDG